MKSPCESCAFTEGSAANLEPKNNIKAQVCVMAGLPFYCHHGQDWQAPDASRRRSAAEMRAEGFETCAGWKREVCGLAAEGYFKKRRTMKKIFGELALGALEIWTSKDVDDEDKEDARGQFEKIFFKLVEERYPSQPKEGK